MKRLIVIFSFITLILALGFFVALSLSLYTGQNWELNNQPIQVKLDEEIIFNSINQWRKDHNLNPLEKSDIVCEIAKIRLYDTKLNWSHEGFNELTNKYYLRDGRIKRLGENLGRYQINENSLVTSWLNSPSHLENIKGNFTHTCITTDKGYTVQIFANY